MTLLLEVLRPFEEALDFDECLDKAIERLKKSIEQGYKAHGDSFAEVGFGGFATHCLRKARDYRRQIVEGAEVGDSPRQVALELATYALLNVAYWEMLERRRENGSES